MILIIPMKQRMNRVKGTRIYQVGEADAGMTVSAYLHKKVGFTKRQISRMKFRENGICLNGAHVRTTTILKAGDELRIKLSTGGKTASNVIFSPETKDGRPSGGSVSFIPKRAKELPSEARSPVRWFSPSPEFSPLKVLYEDEDLLIVDKPAGVVCHPGKGHFADTLMNQAVHYLAGTMKFTSKPPPEQKDEADSFPLPPPETQSVFMELHLIGRLDRDTSGIVVFARSREGAQRLWKQREEGIFTKTYLACVQGNFGKKQFENEHSNGGGCREEDTCQDGKNRVIAFSFDQTQRCGFISAPIGSRAGFRAGERQPMEIRADGKEAETSFRFLWEKEDRTLLEVRIRHGRTHQIRVHMAGIGHPVVGDVLYGDSARNESNIHNKNGACDAKDTGNSKDMPGNNDIGIDNSQDRVRRKVKNNAQELELCAWKVELQKPFDRDIIRIEREFPWWAE